MKENYFLERFQEGNQEEPDHTRVFPPNPGCASRMAFTGNVLVSDSETQFKLVEDHKWWKGYKMLLAVRDGWE